MLLNLIKNSILDILFAILAYMQGGLRKKQLITSFLKRFTKNTGLFTRCSAKEATNRIFLTALEKSWKHLKYNFSVSYFQIWSKKMAYRKSGTQDSGNLQVEHRDLKMSRWNKGPGTLKVGPGSRDSKIFKWHPGPRIPKVGLGNPKVRPGTPDAKLRLLIFCSFNGLFYI